MHIRRSLHGFRSADRGIGGEALRATGRLATEREEGRKNGKLLKETRRTRRDDSVSQQV